MSGSVSELRSSFHSFPSVTSLRWSPDGQVLSLVDYDGNIILIDPQSPATGRQFSGGCNAYCWSPDSALLASTDTHSILTVWHREGGLIFDKPAKGSLEANDISWSPGGELIALACNDGKVRIIDATTFEIYRTLSYDAFAVNSVDWSPDGYSVATTHASSYICIRDIRTKGTIERLAPLGNISTGVKWAQLKPLLAWGCQDGTVVTYDLMRKRTHVFEGHTDEVQTVEFSHDGRLLASRSSDHTIRIWNCESFDQIDCLESVSHWFETDALSFHPYSYLLAATGGAETETIQIWNINPHSGRFSQTNTVHYANSKVVLLGDTGVGKSGLGLVLAGQQFTATDSSHARKIWTMDRSEYIESDGRRVTRDILLWDLAGQPGYRLIHQLHLNEVSTALVLFDSRSETNPFAGVGYWARALDQACGSSAVRKFLVAARTDRSGPAVSHRRIQEVVERYGFDGYFETSAKTGAAMPELAQAIRGSIPWDDLPSATAPETFAAVKDFLINVKETGGVLASRGSMLTKFNVTSGTEVRSDVFDQCLFRLENAGLVKRLTFRDYVLLQPELFDTYCAWMAMAARDEPDGLGYIQESVALAGKFPMDPELRLNNQADEYLMLLATVEEALGRGIVLRQSTERGVMLVFPSAFRVDLRSFPDPYIPAVSFRFEGPITSIYAVLTVRLLNSLAFRNRQLFNNAAVFFGPNHETCGYKLEYPDRDNDAVGLLTVFFEPGISKAVKLLFLRYVNQQLQEFALEGSMERSRMYQCRCSYQIPDDAVSLRRARSETTVLCPVCGTHTPLDDLIDAVEEVDSDVLAMQLNASVEQGRQQRMVVLAERERVKQFQVFICHNGADKPLARELAEKLRNEGILAWIDEAGVLGGDQFVPEMEAIIEAVPAALIVLGPSWLGRWQTQEYYALLQKFVEFRSTPGRKQLRIIPVLLPGATNTDKVPIFLKTFSQIDFRNGGLEDHRELQSLISAILAD
jgi:WD40 repeat protein